MSIIDTDTGSVLSLVSDVSGVLLSDPLAASTLFTDESDSEGSISNSLQTVVRKSVIVKHRPKPINMTSSSDNLSVNTETMDTIHAVMLHKYKKSLLQWDDLYDALDLEVTPTCEKREVLIDLKEMLNSLQEVQLHFETNPLDAFNNAALTKLVQLRGKAADLLTKVREDLYDIDQNERFVTPPPPQNTPAGRRDQDRLEQQQLAENTAQTSEPYISAATQELVTEYSNIAKCKTANISDMKVLEAALESADKEFKDVIAQLDKLEKVATTAASEKFVTIAVNGMTCLRQAKAKATATVKTQRTALGLLPGQRDMSNLGISLPPPKFSGEFSDKMDYYTFVDKSSEYFDVLGAYSDQMKLLKLRADCLLEPALSAVKLCTKFSDAMEKLKTLYGQPKILFNAREEEIEKMGKCPEPPVQRRTWLIDMKNKITDLLHITKTMKLLTRLYSSNVIEVIEDLMRKHDSDKMMDAMFEYQTMNPTFDEDNKHQRLIYLEEYFEHMINLASFEVRYKISKGHKSAKEILQQPRVVSKSSHMANNNNENEESQPTVSSPTRPTVSSTTKPTANQNQTNSDSTQQSSEETQKQDKVYANTEQNLPPGTCKPCKIKHESMAYCTAYRRARIKNRFGQILVTKSCPRCLKMNVEFDIEKRKTWFKEHEKECTDKFVCKIGYCAEKEDFLQQHFTLCLRHIRKNAEMHSEFIETLDKNLVPEDVKFFFTDVAAFSSNARPPTNTTEEWSPEWIGDAEIIEDCRESAVYMLQYVPGPKGEKLMLFFDGGCYGAGISENAYKVLETKCVREGPTYMDVAGGKVVRLENGDEKLHLRLVPENGKERVAAITALRMNNISANFPMWPLQEAWNHLNSEYLKAGGQGKLPEVEDFIGNQPVDIMIGISYNKLFPKEEFYLPSGLCVYRSPIQGFNNKQGILGGPHESWTEALKTAHSMGPAAYLVSEMRVYRSYTSSLYTNLSVEAEKQTCLVPEIEKELEDEECCEDEKNEMLAMMSMPAAIKEMLNVEAIGTEIEYRCGDCRNCLKCKNAETLEKVSLVEEKEQFLIEKSVWYEEEKKILVAKLPFVKDPATSLSDNYSMAKKVLLAQMKNVAKSPELGPQIVASHEKLRSKGFVCKIQDLPETERKLAEQPGYYLPWRPVHSGSLTTPCRMVFDASARCKTGQSLNCILAKGTNMLATLFHLLIQFRVGGSAFTADISMAYNAVQLHPEFYKYQKYLWIEDMKEAQEIITMVIRTLIYGVKSSGNLTMVSHQITADIAARDEELKMSGGPKCLKEKMYMDDCLSSHFNDEKRDKASDGLVSTLDVGSMQVKAISKSGQKPPEKASANGQHVGLVGYLWDTEKDCIQLDIKPLYLDKVKRGKLPRIITENVREELAEKFTRRVLCSKVAGVFDPLGLATPVTAKLKMDLSEIVSMTEGWDDPVDVKHLDKWVQNLQEIQNLAEIRVPRSVYNLSDTENTAVELIVATDASEKVAATAVYARIKRENEVQCLLVAAKSKLVGTLTIPRAEMKACCMGACLAAIVKRNFDGKVTKTTFVTDSSVALCWMQQDLRPLQTGVRNQVIQLRRFSDVSEWRHINSELNPADLASRGGQVAQVGENSEWQNGMSWMREEYENMPLRKVEEVIMSQREKTAVKKEIRNSDLQGIAMMSKMDEISERYAMSKYIIDPCAQPWNKFLRKMTVLWRVAKIWRKKAAPFQQVNGAVIVCTSEEDSQGAQRYIFERTTAECKKFNEKKKLEDGILKDGILIFGSRILDDTKVEEPAGTMLDLKPLKFAVPMVDKLSPVAYSVMVFSHVTLSRHGGSFSTLRMSREIIFVLRGKELANEIIENCQHCKRYKAKLLEAAMGKQHSSRLTIAPAFYSAQVDLFGPLEAFCKHGRRSTVKVYGIVFKCPTTLAVAAGIMDDYSTESFMDAFYRFAARYGVPAKMYIDAGSQLLAGCRNATISLQDITRTLNGNHGVKLEFEVCPVGSHEAHGMVERQIREVKRIMEVTCRGLKFDILKWETVLMWISNELNSLPLALGNRCSNLENMDLITPSRLLMGRNNRRAIVDLPELPKFSEMTLEMEAMEKSWWNVWSREKLVDLIPQPKKWKKGSPDVKDGDVVVFQKEKNALGGPTWRIGEIEGVETSRDGVSRRVSIKYKNVNERVYRYTRRSVRDVAVVWRERDLDLPGMLGEAQRRATVCMHVSTK